MTTNNPFGEMISSYSRAQAIEDGVLVDLTERSKKYGFKFPIVCTDTLAEGVMGNGTDEERNRRLEHFLFHVAEVMKANKNLRSDRLSGTAEGVNWWIHCGPGDTPDPVLTIMLQGED